VRLVDCFIEAVTYVLDVVRKPQSFPQYDTTRAKVEELLTVAGRMAKTLGVAASEFQDARFAACAWMDEAVLGSRWEGKALWLHQPLQRTVYGTVNAGDEYFDRLDGLLGRMDKDFSFTAPGERSSVDELSFGEARPAGTVGAGGAVEAMGMGGLGEAMGEATPEVPEIGACPAPGKNAVFTPTPGLDDTGIGLKGVLEVYGLTMMLGFTGKYFHPDDQGTLKSLRQRAVAAALGENARFGRDQATRLFPRLYGPEGAGGKPRRRFWRGLDWADMVVIGLPVLALAVMFYAYNFILSGALKGFLGGP